MNKKLALICAILGMIGGILLIIGGFMEDAFPKALRFVAAFCLLCNCAASVMNLKNIQKTKKDK